MSVWLDDISRDRLRTGNLQELIDDSHVVGVTSNPTIFAKALSNGRRLRRAGRGPGDPRRDGGRGVPAITTYDIRWACDVLRPVYDATGGLDGRVSLEVDPRLARDTATTIAEARALWWMVDRPNLFIKIPATLEGLPAITAAIAEGISVNVTLIFSLERYGEVIDAYMAGLEQAAAAGHDLSQIRSVASFFVSRMDTEVDARLDKLGTPEAEALRGKAAIANARLAYELFEQRIAADALAGPGGQGRAGPAAAVGFDLAPRTRRSPTPCTWSTWWSADTVNTMPEGTIKAMADHGELLGDTVHGTYDASRQVLADLEKLGISYDDVVQVLEDEGVAKFEASWTELLETIKRTGALSGDDHRGWPWFEHDRRLGMTAEPGIRGPGPGQPRRHRGTRRGLRAGQSAARSAGPAHPAGRRAMRAGHVRRHRRPGAQEADAGHLRPGQPRACCRRASRSSASPAGTGRTRISPRSPTRR